jgi:hypothetical protein
LEIDAEYWDVLYHTEVQWLNFETVFKRFLALKIEIEMFMNEKGKVVAELIDEKWLWDLAFLCDISYHVNDLNTILKV